MAPPTHRLLRSLRPFVCSSRLRLLASPFSSSAAAAAAAEEEKKSPWKEADDVIYVRRPSSAAAATRDSTSVTMPMAFMTGSIVGKRFYKEVTTRLADDGNGWTVMLDYRTLKTPAKRVLNLPSLALAKAIAAEWEYQQTDGIRPFTMPLMKLACTALERVPLTRVRVIENLMKRFHQDLVFCRSPGDSDLTKGVRGRENRPILDWCNLNSDLNHCVSRAFRLGIEEAIDLIRLKKISRWIVGLVRSHDVDIADLKCKCHLLLFSGLSRRS
ncbi:ATP synthase mitochondrial F1 complex assembly factor 2 [Ananas comosus]|uniref:ATP synthase mitochondrial F1 complex assembly factor 2 n=1 Tax=Ananas comosus TaxID=4615 RepID=A0A199VU50_ANACO|nr:ATP synthase mitochondrial F1 complex assembly factor 2 [Ananas comosus]